MPRGRPRKNVNDTDVTKKKQDVQEQPNEITEDYARKFASVVQNILGNGSSLYSPIWTNEILKSLNMTPHFYDRERVKELIANPKANEKALKDLAQYIYNTVHQFKRLVIYMSEMLSYSYYLTPTNADEEDMSKANFKNSYKKVTQFMNDLDPKQHFPDIVQSMLLEDGKFYYLREGEYGYWFQEMPQDFCRIWAKTELGYQYAFDLTYLLKPGINIDRDFAPEFKEYFSNFLNGEEYQGNKDKFKERRWYYWQTLDASKAKIFKFDQIRAGLTPPLIGTFLDAIEILTFKDLLKSKTALDVYKLLVAKIPIDKDNASKGGKKDNFAVTAETAAKFQTIMQNALQQGIKVISTPLEVEAINLNQAETKDSIVGLGSQEFWDTSGTSSILFSGSKMNASTMSASIKTDETFVTHLYRQIACFYNFKLREISGKYRWKITFEGTKFDQADRFDRAMKVVNIGGPLSYVAAAMDKPQHEFMNLLSFEKAMGMKDKMVPLISSSQMSGKNSGGRPTKPVEQLSPDGETTKDNEGNVR